MSGTNWLIVCWVLSAGSESDSCADLRPVGVSLRMVNALTHMFRMCN